MHATAFYSFEGELQTSQGRYLSPTNIEAQQCYFEILCLSMQTIQMTFFSNNYLAKLFSVKLQWINCLWNIVHVFLEGKNYTSFGSYGTVYHMPLLQQISKTPVGCQCRINATESARGIKHNATHQVNISNGISIQISTFCQKQELSCRAKKVWANHGTLLQWD